MRKYILLLLMMHFVLLFMPFFGFDLTSFSDGIELLKQPFYFITFILNVAFVCLDKISKGMFMTIITTLCLIFYEIYYALTWYISKSVVFDIAYAVDLTRISFYILLIIDVIVLLLEIINYRESKKAKKE